MRYHNSIFIVDLKRYGFTMGYAFFLFCYLIRTYLFFY